MKKVIYMFLLSILIGIAGCESNDERLKKEIPGRYYLTQTESDEGLFLTSESTIMFESDGLYNESASLSISTFVPDYGMITLKYLLTVKGSYNIHNSFLSQIVNTNSIQIEPLISEEYEYAFLYEYYAPLFEEHLIPDLKQKLREGMGGRIVELDDSKLILIDHNGGQVVLEKAPSILKFLEME